MKSISTRILCLMFLSLCFVACKKDGTSTKKTSSEPLFDGSWKLTTFEIKGSDSTWIKVTPLSVIADVTYSFKSDGTYAAFSNGSQSFTGNWSMFDNGQTLSWGVSVYHIVTLNSTTMVLVNPNETFNYLVNGTGGTYYSERDTYTH